MLDYLESVLDNLSRAASEKEVAEIRRELMDAGVCADPRAEKSARRSRSVPVRYVSGTGYEILVGRSNTQNDELTFKTARRTDIWLHAAEDTRFARHHSGGGHGPGCADLGRSRRTRGLLLSGERKRKGACRFHTGQVRKKAGRFLARQGHIHQL